MISVIDKVSIFKIVDQDIKFYSQNTNLLPPKLKSTFRHLKQGIQDFHRKYVLVPADKAATKDRIKHDLLQTQVLVLQLNFQNY